MSKPTHILVPIAEAHTIDSDLVEFVTKYRSHMLVDLSEEGIEKRAATHFPAHDEPYEQGDRDAGGYEGYQLCAKDLLNTKP